MIKINLLPRAARRRRVTVSRTGLLSVVGLVVVLGAMFYLWWYTSNQVERLRVDLDKAQAELKDLTEAKKKVEQFEQRKKLLEERNGAIEKLAAQQSGPVQLMDELSRALPEKVWLTSVAKTGNKLVIQGFAFTDFDVAALMTALGKAPMIQNVELTVSERTVVERVEVKKFEITATVAG